MKGCRRRIHPISRSHDISSKNMIKKIGSRETPKESEATDQEVILPSGSVTETATAPFREKPDPYIATVDPTK